MTVPSMSSAPKRSEICAIFGVIICQYDLTCGKLSSTRRLTAICLMSSMPVVVKRCCSGVFAGWKASGMKVWKPPVSSCKARGFEPLIAVNFVIADDVAHAVGENFGASSRQRVDPRFFHFFKRLADRQL